MTGLAPRLGAERPPRGLFAVKQVRKSSAERTNIVLDSKLVERVKRLANVKTTRYALRSRAR